MIKVFREFKEFAIKGNMIDIAVGVIVGAAFNKVIDVIVNNILTPPLSLLTNDIDFQNKEWILREAVITNGKIIHAKVAIGYGELITVLINFFIIAWTVFVVVKLANRLRRKADDPDNTSVVTPTDVQLLSDLKKLMEEQNELLKKQIDK
ncbi:large conductance mechanosensitive channel protein MscL [Zhouia sp. PK063]|uniref:large conductance mechanosensitive channel protein MscL n=1 Tax=Zhouia sp. PK063 TaxID=3373602 RepID=UPI00379375F6